MEGQRYEFSALIEDAGGGGAFVRVPLDVESVFGAGRVKVRAWIEGVEYRGSLVRMGTPCHILPVLKEIRTRLGRKPGDTVRIVIEKDEDERTVELPGDLARALASRPGLEDAFAGLSYTRRREAAARVASAKRPETRAGRVAEIIGRLEAEQDGKPGKGRG